MAILDFIKKKKKLAKEEGKKEKAEGEEGAVKKEGLKDKSVNKTQLAGVGKYSGIIRFPHVTEKSSYGVKSRQYIFRVIERANKHLVKKAIEDIYNVSVIDVKIINVPSKTKRLGRTLGKKSGYKKAIVKLKEGASIEVMPQ